MREEEEQVKTEIEHALEKQNLDRERAMAGEESEAENDGVGGVKSSAAILGDLEEVRRKVEKYHARHNLEGLPEVQAKAEAVASCYKSVLALRQFSQYVSHAGWHLRTHHATSLDCWREVEEFKVSVSQVEQVSCVSWYTSSKGNLTIIHSDT